MAILRRNCPHCPTEQVAFTLVWNDRIPNKEPHIWNCCATCGACNGPICFTASKTNRDHTPPLSSASNIEPSFTIGNVWPVITPAFAPPHTPQPVAKRYLEGEDAFRRGNWNSAVAMYRSALDIGTKGMAGVPPNQTFFQRLVWLHSNHGITPDIRSWADHVRVEGNAALHDPDEFSEIDAKALRFFTEMFLRYVFELPGAVREFRGAVEPPAQAPPA